MALTDPGTSKTVSNAIFPEKVTLARACKAGDVLGVAEDNFDDLGPAFANKDAHITDVTYLPRLVAGTDGAIDDVITAYGIAEVTGLTSAVAFKKVYMALTTALKGQLSESAPTQTGDCSSVIGISKNTSTVKLFPMLTPGADTIAS